MVNEIVTGAEIVAVAFVVIHHALPFALLAIATVAVFVAVKTSRKN